jgi:hypothetical protein
MSSSPRGKLTLFCEPVCMRASSLPKGPVATPSFTQPGNQTTRTKQPYGKHERQPPQRDTEPPAVGISCTWRGASIPAGRHPHVASKFEGQAVCFPTIFAKQVERLIGLDDYCVGDMEGPTFPPAIIPTWHANLKGKKCVFPNLPKPSKAPHRSRRIFCDFVGDVVEDQEVCFPAIVLKPSGAPHRSR